MKRGRVVCGLIALMLLWGIAVGQGMVAAGKILHGPIGKVALWGDYSVTASGSELLVFDSDAVLERTVNLGSAVRDVVVLGDEAFAVCDGGNLFSVDIASGTIDGESHISDTLNTLSIAGSYLYVGGERTLYTVSLSGSGFSTMGIETEISLPSRVTAMGGSNNFLAVGLNDGGVRLYDALGTLMDVANTAGIVRDVAITDSGYLYAAAGRDGLVIFHLNDAGSLERIAVASLSSEPRAIALNGDVAYIACGLTGIVAMDISDKSSPSIMDNWSNGHYFYDVVAAGEIVAGAAWVGGIEILDAADPEALTERAVYDMVGFANKVVQRDDYLYVAFSAGGLITADVADPISPSVVDREPSSAANDIALGRNYLYLLDQVEGIKTYDLSYPSHPVLVSTVTVDGFPRAIAANNDYLFVVDYAGAIHTYSLSNPAHPVDIGGRSTSYSLSDIVLNSRFAFLSAGINGVVVYDIHYNPSTPLFVNALDIGGNVEKIAIDPGMNKLAVATDDGEIHLIDVGSVYAMSEIGNIATGRTIADIAISNGYLFAATGSSGLYLYDAINPDDIELTEHISSFNALGISMDDQKGLVSLVLGSDGVEIVNARDIISPKLIFHRGWNAISPSVLINDPATLVAISHIALASYWYNPATRFYTTSTSLSPDAGFFLLANRDTTLYVTGERVISYTAHIEPGWNLVSFGCFRRPLSFIHSLGDYIIPTLYWYNPESRAYEVEDTYIHPDRAYWFISHIAADIEVSPTGMEMLRVVAGGSAEGGIPPLPPRNGVSIPSSFRIAAAYPNPFNSTVTFRVELPAEGDVAVDIYDVTGRRVLDEIKLLPVGTSILEWTPMPNTPAGIYTAVVRSDFGTKTVKVMYLK